VRLPAWLTCPARSGDGIWGLARDRAKDGVLITYLMSDCSRLLCVGGIEKLREKSGKDPTIAYPYRENRAGKGGWLLD